MGSIPRDNFPNPQQIPENLNIGPEKGEMPSPMLCLSFPDCAARQAGAVPIPLLGCGVVQTPKCSKMQGNQCWGHM